jgi:hypothetical protein
VTACGVEMEGARAGEGGIAAGAFDLKKSAALDHHIERVVGIGEIALGKDDLVRRGAGAEAKLQAGGDHGCGARL